MRKQLLALAYGTESIPKVDKIVGPGNLYVALAKREVYGIVNIDMIAGPSEIVVIADETGNAKYIAADLLSQAEHDERATAICITTNIELAKEVEKEIERQLETLPRSEIARESIKRNGAIFIVPSLEEALNLSNEIAPEHLELHIKRTDECSSLCETCRIYLSWTICTRTARGLFSRTESRVTDKWNGKVFLTVISR